MKFPLLKKRIISAIIISVFTSTSSKVIKILFVLLFLVSNVANADIVKEIVKKYKLDPEKNPKDQCVLMDKLYIMFQSRGRFNKGGEEIRKNTNIPYFKTICDAYGDCSINNEVFTKSFDEYYKGNISDGMVLFFDKAGNKIGYFSGLTDSFGYEDMDYQKEKSYSLQKGSKKNLDYVEAMDPNINLSIKGCYITYLRNLKTN